MVRVRMKSPEVWKTFVKSVVNLIGEGAMKFESDGVKMKAIDPSRAVLVDFHLKKDAFEAYEVKESKLVGVKFDELEKVLSRAKSDDELIMELDETQGKLAITFKGASTRKLSIPLISVDERELPEPKIQFTAEVEVTGEVIQDGLKDAEMVGETIKFIVDKDEFQMIGEGTEGRSELKLSKGDKGLVKISVQQPAKSKFGLKNIAEITRGVKGSDVVKISLGTDIPLQLELPLENGKLRFFVAPYIDVE
ncbi:MAG: proliferating cell nuclear antigen (pcna) [Candidatus Hadarchaeales archaeon]